MVNTCKYILTFNFTWGILEDKITSSSTVTYMYTYLFEIRLLSERRKKTTTKKVTWQLRHKRLTLYQLRYHEHNHYKKALSNNYHGYYGPMESCICAVTCAYVNVLCVASGLGILQSMTPCLIALHYFR